MNSVRKCDEHLPESTVDGLRANQAFAVFKLHVRRSIPHPKRFEHRNRVYRVKSQVTARDLCLMGMVNEAVTLRRAVNPWLPHVILEGCREP